MLGGMAHPHTQGLSMNFPHEISSSVASSTAAAAAVSSSNQLASSNSLMIHGNSNNSNHLNVQAKLISHAKQKEELMSMLEFLIEKMH